VSRPYDVAYRAAYDALDGVKARAVRDILAENVAATVIGKGDWGRDRWEALASNDDRRVPLVRAALRDFSPTVSTGPVDAAVKAAAQALLDQEN
jgi:hypothetical protein